MSKTYLICWEGRFEGGFLLAGDGIFDVEKLNRKTLDGIRKHLHREVLNMKIPIVIKNGDGTEKPAALVGIAFRSVCELESSVIITRAG